MGGVVSSIGDFVGDVVGGIGDVAGNIVGSVVDNLNPSTLAAIAYMATTGDPSALLAEAGSEEAAASILSNLGTEGISSIAGNYGVNSVFTNPQWESLISTAGTDPSILSNIGGVGSSLNGGTWQDILSSGVNAADVGTGTAGGYTFGTDGSILDASGNVIADAATSAEFGKAGLGLGDIYNYVKNGLSIANLTGILGKGGSILNALMPSSTDVGDIFSSLGSLAPLAAAGGLGYLGYKNQSDINKTITDAYNNYLGKQSEIASAYGVDKGPQQLNYNVAGVPLAQAQPRTAAQTVVTPKAATGGSINDLFDEYSMLNNRMRNYRRLARGGLI